jgi:amidohydrolase
MLLKPEQIQLLTDFRKELHRNPELSGKEKNTAKRIVNFIRKFEPDKIIKNLGGHGVAAVFDSKQAGPSVLIRGDIDALPIQEKNNIDYVSQTDNVAHLCGHDGHTTILAGLAMLLKNNPPQKGKVVLLFQPAEETGQGAQAVVDDPKFKEIEPDYAFALHNLPGYPKHSIIISRDIFASASKGMIIKMTGKTSHAAEPENGISPAHALAFIINEIELLPEDFDHFTASTIVYAKMGEKAFGTSPADLEVNATFRAYRNKDMDMMCKIANASIGEIAKAERLTCDISWTEEFPSTENDPYCVSIIEKAISENNLDFRRLKKPFKWSEDFGVFTTKYRGAMFGLGSGTKHQQLHNPDYDFPDEIIETGIGMFYSIVNQLNF